MTFGENVDRPASIPHQLVLFRSLVEEIHGDDDPIAICFEPWKPLIVLEITPFEFPLEVLVRMALIVEQFQGFDDLG